MQARIIFSKIWEDAFFVNLSVPEKLLFFYYLTNSRVNIINCYECQDRQVVFDLGTPTKIVAEFKKKAEAEGKLFFKGNYVFIKNAEKYQKYTGSKNETAKLTAIDRLPEEISSWRNSLLGEKVVDRGIDSTIYTHQIRSNNQYYETNTGNQKAPDTPPEKSPTEKSRQRIRETLGIRKKVIDQVRM